MNRSSGSVRIGPVSIFSLMIILCLAVMAVLSITTAHASLMLTDRQAEATSDLYRNQIVAERFVANVDAVAKTSGTAADAAARIQQDLPTLISDAEEAAGDESVEVSAKVEGTQVEADFLCDDYQNLNVVIALSDGGGYQITSWLVGTVWPEEEPTEVLFGVN